MIKRTTAIVLALAIVLGGSGLAGASTGSENAALKAAKYLRAQQRDDGGFGAKESNIIETCVAIFSIRGAGAALPKAKTGKTVIDYLESAAPALASNDKKVAVQNTSKVAHLIMALKLTGQNPRDFNGTDWVKFLQENKEKATGWYGYSDLDHMWALLALKAAGEPIETNSINWLKGRQNVNGGYEWDKGAGMGTDTNSTALAMQALIGAGVKSSDSSVKKAKEYLKTQQNTDGGFPYVTPSPYGTESDTSSTAWVLQALIAAGEDIESKYWVKTSVTPMGFLMSMQNANGAFAYQKAVPDDSLLCTGQAGPALMLKPFPVKITPPTPVKVDKPASKAMNNIYMIIWIVLAAICLLAALGFGLWFFGKRKKG